MTGYRTCLAFILVLLCLIQAAPAARYDAAGSSYVIPDSGPAGWGIEISGDNLIWIVPGDDGRGQDLYLYNVTGDKSKRIASSKYTTFHPAMGKGSVLWGERYESSGPVMLTAYDIGSGNYSLIDPNPSNQDFPASDGGSVVWLDSRTGGFTNIYIMNKESGGSALFHSSKTSDKHNPSICPGYVYWVEKGSLFRKNIETGYLENVLEGVANDFSISKGKIVWEYGNSEDIDIAMFDAGMMSAKVIVEKPGDQLNPDIDGNNIVWQEYEDGAAVIRIKNIDTGISALLYSSGYLQSEPVISGNRIAWFDSAPGIRGVRIFELETKAKPQAEFTSDTKPSLPPHTVHFATDITTPVNERFETLWDFGDGATSREVEPEHTYTTPGVYNVTLTISNKFGRSIVFKPEHVIIGELPRPEFYSDVTTGDTPLKVKFYDKSSGPYEERMWNFGDGIGSILKSPVHTYETPGIYTVSLTLSNEYGSVTEEKFAYIRAGRDMEKITIETGIERVVKWIILFKPWEIKEGTDGTVIPPFEIKEFLKLLKE